MSDLYKALLITYIGEQNVSNFNEILQEAPETKLDETLPYEKHEVS